MTIRPEVRGKEEEKISGQERYESDLRKRESKRRRIDRGLREASKERRCMHGSQLSCPFAAPSGPLMGQFRRLKSFTRTDSRERKRGRNRERNAQPRDHSFTKIRARSRPVVSTKITHQSGLLTNIMEL
jgi:hypothetical protein